MWDVCRIIIERLHVHKPYPWGLMITFRELMQNQRYEFQKKRFMKGSKELDTLLESIQKNFENLSKTEPSAAAPGTRQQRK